MSKKTPKQVLDDWGRKPAKFWFKARLGLGYIAILTFGTLIVATLVFAPIGFLLDFLLQDNYFGNAFVAFGDFILENILFSLLFFFVYTSLFALLALNIFRLYMNDRGDFRSNHSDYDLPFLGEEE